VRPTGSRQVAFAGGRLRDDDGMAEFRDRPEPPDQLEGEPAPESGRRARYTEERAAIRAAMDQAVTEPAFALSPEQEAGLSRARALSPNEAANYHPPSAADLRWINGDRDRGVEPYRRVLDTEAASPDDPRTPRESMRGMPGLSPDAAERYLGAVGFGERPWLRPVHAASLDARRVIATVDHGDGHALHRHEGAASGDAARDRVERLHDPANPDDAGRTRAEDAFAVDADGKPRRHRCGSEATAIADPDAFATAIARALDHPVVGGVLRRPFDPSTKPRDVDVPISELLGADGHEACEGYRLVPIDGSASMAMENRAEWVKAARDAAPTRAVEPSSEKIETFEGGNVVFAFQPRTGRGGYEIMTMYPKPAGS
jgi:hypothetical protein